MGMWRVKWGVRRGKVSGRTGDQRDSCTCWKWGGRDQVIGRNKFSWIMIDHSDLPEVSFLCCFWEKVLDPIIYIFLYQLKASPRVYVRNQIPLQQDVSRWQYDTTPWIHIDCGSRVPPIITCIVFSLQPHVYNIITYTWYQSRHWILSWGVHSRSNALFQNIPL